MNPNSTNVLSDNELLKQYSQGNSSAFQTLFNRHKDRIFTSINLMVKDKYAAEDIFQDVFIKVIDTISAGKYTEEGKFLPWVLRIAHNACIDHFRKAKRMPSVSISDNESMFEELIHTNKSADKDIVQSQTTTAVRKLIDSLPEDLRDVLILRHYAELSFKEIAEIMNCSINTALGRMRYALLNMRKLAEGMQLSY